MAILLVGDYMAKMSDRYYKSQNFIYMDVKNKRSIDVFSEYGYNLDSSKREVIDEGMMFKRPKTFVNKDFLKIKR